MSRHPTPPLWLLASLYVAFFVASLVVQLAVARGTHMPNPFAGEAEAVAWFPVHADAIRWSSFLQFCSAVPLLLFTVVAADRARSLGAKGPGPSIALGGGIAAAAMQLVAALTIWTISAAPHSPALRALQLFAFAAGGPGFVLPLGLLILGLAVSGGLSRLLMQLGFALSAICALSVLVMVIDQAAFLLPAGRLLTFGWLIWAGAELPRGPRRELHEEAPSEPLTA